VDDKQNNVNISPESLTFEKSIELRDVSFHYDDSQEMILQNISLHIDKGECVGVRGSSGVGKTTLFNIILGLHTPTSGDVYVDDVKLCADNIRSWQSKIGYVSQSVFIADMTLAENIALGCSEDDIDYTRVNEILRLVNLEEFVATLPLGVHSRIGEQGCRISGGQRQRIGIARALYKGAEILLFDEATSSLDSKTEESINDAIRMLSAKNNLTIVIIAHRESSLEYCNRIITL
jgi:ABC-type multidrug transport system fused ATPase/permease subunit